MSYPFITIINEDTCIGDSLPYINENYINLSTGLTAVSAQDTFLKQRFNTLIQTLTSFATLGTTYNTLSTSFRGLSSLLLP
jgi:hypothetical protein